MEKIEEIAGEPLLVPASPKELRNYFEQTRGISRAGERTVGRKGLQALLDEGKAFVIFKDRGCGPCIAHEVAGVVDGGIELAEPIDAWDVVSL